MDKDPYSKTEDESDSWEKVEDFLLFEALVTDLLNSDDDEADVTYTVSVSTNKHHLHLFFITLNFFSHRRQVLSNQKR